MEFHPVASIFPMMSAEEFDALKADIQTNGLQEPIWTYQGKIIDGRNRYQACVFLGVQPDYREWDGEGSLVLFVVSLNLSRRHLTSSQKAVVALEVEKALAEEAKTRTGGRPVKTHDDARGENRVPANGWWSVDDMRRERERKNGKPEQIFAQVSDRGPQSRDQAAAIVGTNRQYVSDAKKLAETAPDLLAKVHSGDMRIPEAKREMKSRQSAEIRTQAAAGIEQTNSNIIVGDYWTNADKVPDNSLSLIFTDPPYQIREGGCSLWNLAEFAERKLAPGGSILFYLGHVQLSMAFKAFDKMHSLRHWWTCACVHGGGMTLMHHYGIRVGWKPMLWFVKESRFDTQNIVVDTVSTHSEKQYHKWQQSEEEAAYWIEKLCPADGIVCDPFLGGGTTAAAAKKLNRKWIGFEIDPETARIASGRLEKENDQTV